MEVKNPNIVLFHGENIYMLERTLEKTRANFVEKHGDLNITILEDEEEITAKSIMGAMKAAPFLGEKRLIIVKNFLRLGDSDDQDKIEKFLEEIPDTSVVIFYENPNVETRKRPKSTLKKTLLAWANVKFFEQTSPEELTTWIINRLQKNNATISRSLCEEIIGHAGGDMQTISNEVGKIALYCENRAVTAEDIGLLISHNYSATIFQFTDALNAKDAKQAIQKLHTVMEMGEEILPILGMIARHFRHLILVKDLLQNHKIPKSQIHGKMLTYDPAIKTYPVQLAVDQSAKFTLDQLKSIYSGLLDINFGLKTGKIPMGKNDKLMMVELEKFVLSITQRSNG